MSYETYTAPEHIVNRAVLLWQRMLSNPKYDNLGSKSRESAESIRANTFASILASGIPKNNTPEVLAAFGRELKAILHGPFEWTYTDYSGASKTYVKEKPSYLSVDYHPDAELAVAAKRSGLKMEFPWKTNMHLHNGYVSLGYGYGAPYVYHRQMPNGRWLTSTLTGTDEEMDKVVQAVMDGRLDLPTEDHEEPAL